MCIRDRHCGIRNYFLVGDISAGEGGIRRMNGEIDRYNIFHASMLVRHSNDGKMYLYDIIDIKKETSNSLGE